MRQWLHNFYYSDNILPKIWKVGVYVLIFASLVPLLMEYGILENKLTTSHLLYIDITVAFVFFSDYMFRFYIAPERLKFVRDIYNIFDLIAIMPSFLFFLQGFEILRAARIVRALRALRVLRLLRVAHALEYATRPKEKLAIPAGEEITYYHLLFEFYKKNKEGEKTVPLAKITKDLFNRLNKEMLASARKNQLGEREVLVTSFYELLRQIYPVVKSLQKTENPLELRKLRYLLREMGELLVNITELESANLLDERKISRSMYLYLLIKGSLNDVIITVTIAFCINIFIRMAGFDDVLNPVLLYIGVIEGVLGTLIIFITTFNIKFASAKRQAVEHRAVYLMNYLTSYATRIRTSVDNFEKNDKRRKEVITELKYHFDSIGFIILNSVESQNMRGVCFDTGVMQTLERIRFIIKPYKEKMDARTYDKYEEMHSNCVNYTNQFQVESTIGIPVIFNELNHALIRVTYFTLITLSPLAAIPRIILMNILQRAFFRVAQEADRSILRHSLAKIPLGKRMIRRLCRIGAIFSY